MGVAALVLGIIGTLFSIIPGLFWIGVPLALVALILGIVGRKAAVTSNQPTGSATAGMVLGIVGLAIGILMWILCSLMVHNAEKGFENLAFKKALEEAQKQQQQQNK